MKTSKKLLLALLLVVTGSSVEAVRTSSRARAQAAQAAQVQADEQAVAEQAEVANGSASTTRFAGLKNVMGDLLNSRRPTLPSFSMPKFVTNVYNSVAARLQTVPVKVAATVVGFFVARAIVANATGGY